jgi:Lar family restriction alleviation protein
MIELKKCPFCGSKADMAGTQDTYLIVCCSCGSGSNAYDTEKDAVDAWNKRTIGEFVRLEDINKMLIHARCSFNYEPLTMQYVTDDINNLLTYNLKG